MLDECDVPDSSDVSKSEPEIAEPPAKKSKTHLVEIKISKPAKTDKSQKNDDESKDTFFPPEMSPEKIIDLTETEKLTPKNTASATSPSKSERVSGEKYNKNKKVNKEITNYNKSNKFEILASM